jgi:hypothetical protein
MIYYILNKLSSIKGGVAKMVAHRSACYWTIFTVFVALEFVSLLLTVTGIHRTVLSYDKGYDQAQKLSCRILSTIENTNGNLMSSPQSEKFIDLSVDIDNLGKTTISRVSCQEPYDPFPGDCSRKFPEGAPFVCYISDRGIKIWTASSEIQKILYNSTVYGLFTTLFNIAFVAWLICITEIFSKIFRKIFRMLEIGKENNKDKKDEKPNTEDTKELEVKKGVEKAPQKNVDSAAGIYTYYVDTSHLDSKGSQDECCAHSSSEGEQKKIPKKNENDVEEPIEKTEDNNKVVSCNDPVLFGMIQETRDEVTTLFRSTGLCKKDILKIRGRERTTASNIIEHAESIVKINALMCNISSIILDLRRDVEIIFEKTDTGQWRKSKYSHSLDAVDSINKMIQIDEVEPILSAMPKDFRDQIHSQIYKVADMCTKGLDNHVTIQKVSDDSCKQETEMIYHDEGVEPKMMDE